MNHSTSNFLSGAEKTVSSAPGECFAGEKPSVAPEENNFSGAMNSFSGAMNHFSGAIDNFSDEKRISGSVK